MAKAKVLRNHLPWILAALALATCKPAGDPEEPAGVRLDFVVTGQINIRQLNEISGMEVLSDPTLIVHNDDGEPELFVVESNGNLIATLQIDGAVNRDWEDLTWIPNTEGRWLAIGDIGDNLGRRESIRIYFADIPARFVTSQKVKAVRSVPLQHMLELTYPDGPRDCEAMAYDPSSGKILLLTKRDWPPRLYGVDASTALTDPRAELEFLGEATRFRLPTQNDIRRLGRDGAWVSQPTGLDIDANGTLAAVITYRSLYLFRRTQGQGWADAFREAPREFLGPVSRGEEAIAFSDAMDALYITTEGRSAPIYRVALPPPRD